MSFPIHLACYKIFNETRLKFFQNCSYEENQEIKRFTAFQRSHFQTRFATTVANKTTGYSRDHGSTWHEVRKILQVEMLKIMLYIGMTVRKHYYLELAKHCGDFIEV